jgi:hypothetical protein
MKLYEIQGKFRINVLGEWDPAAREIMGNYLTELIAAKSRSHAKS